MKIAIGTQDGVIHRFDLESTTLALDIVSKLKGDDAKYITIVLPDGDYSICTAAVCWIKTTE